MLFSLCFDLIDEGGKNKSYPKLLDMVFTYLRGKINHSFFEGVLHLNEQQFDKFLHINTMGEQYGFPKLAHYHRYEPTPYAGLEQSFEQYVLPENPVFVDMGCGKGRVPIYIHDKFGIPTVGIEMDAGFYTEAEYNKKSYVQKKHTGTAITFEHVIAEQYPIKAVDNIFFFFNPFSIKIFRTVVHNIWKSYEQNMREIHIVLYYPAHDYLQFLDYGTPFALAHEVHLRHETNINERLCVFILKKA